MIKKLARQYRFGYHTVEDLEQEAFVLAWSALPRWDGQRSLYNFIYTHVKNRLQTFVRDNYMKPCPCSLCYGKGEGETEHEDKLHCKKYHSWYAANKRRGNIMSPIGITCVDEEGETKTYMPDTVSKDAENAEIFDLIDKNIPHDMRGTYLRMKEGVTGVSAEERERVLAKIREIVGAN